MNRNLTFKSIKDFIANVSYSYISGIEGEIAEILSRLQMKGEKRVKDFALFFDQDTNQYRVVVILKDDTFSTVQNIFFSFFECISYTGANIIISQKTERGIHYALASLDEQGKGFYCEIDFLPEGASTEDGEQQREEETSVQTETVSFSQRKHPAVQWKFEVDSANYFPLLASQEMIYSVGSGGELYAIDAKRGILRWHWQADQPHEKITTLPSVDQGVLAVYTSARSRFGLYEATLSVLDTQTGQLLRSFPVPALQSIGQCHLLTVHNGIAYLSGTDRNLPPSRPQSLCLALDLQTGRQAWSADLEKYLGTTTPVIANAQVYLVTYDIQPGHPMVGFLHALDIQTGKEIWSHRFETHGIQEMIVRGTEIFVTGTRTEVIDALTGGTTWSLPNLNTFQDSPLTVNNELIYINYEQASASRKELETTKSQEVLLAGGPLRAGKLIAIERASKQPRWVADLTHGRSIPTMPVLAGPAIYTTWEHLDSRGVVTHATLFALDARTGQERWQFEAEHLSPPLVGEGMVFVRGQEGEKEYIYALSEDESFSHAG